MEFHLSLAVHDESANSHSMWSIRRNGAGDVCGDPVYEHKVVRLGMVVAKPFLQTVSHNIGYGTSDWQNHSYEFHDVFQRYATIYLDCRINEARESNWQLDPHAFLPLHFQDHRDIHQSAIDITCSVKQLFVAMGSGNIPSASIARLRLSERWWRPLDPSARPSSRWHHCTHPPYQPWAAEPAPCSRWTSLASQPEKGLQESYITDHFSGRRRLANTLINRGERSIQVIVALTEQSQQVERTELHRRSQAYWIISWFITSDRKRIQNLEIPMIIELFTTVNVDVVPCYRQEGEECNGDV